MTSDSKLHKFGFFSGRFFTGTQGICNNWKKIPNWLKEHRKLEEQYAGYELDTPFSRNDERCNGSC